MNNLVKQLQGFITDACPYVAKIKSQLTDDEAKHLLEEYPLDDLKKMLLNMDNRPGISKKYMSVYRTLLNWFESDIRKGWYVKKIHVKRAPYPQNSAFENSEEQRKERFLNEFPKGSAVMYNDQVWEVQDNCFLRNTVTGRFMIPSAVFEIQKNLLKPIEAY